MLAKQLLEMLPPELASMSVDEFDVQATEYLHYRQFFTIWETLERVVECRRADGDVCGAPQAEEAADRRGGRARRCGRGAASPLSTPRA